MACLEAKKYLGVPVYFNLLLFPAAIIIIIILII